MSAQAVKKHSPSAGEGGQRRPASERGRRAKPPEARRQRPVSVQPMNRGAVRLIVIALVSVSALATVASTVLATRAATKPANIAATRTYLRARHSYEQAIKSDGPADQASAHAFVAQVTAECPNVLAGAPPGKATEEIAREANREVQQAFERPERGPSIAFARRIERLRWTNRKLTYYVRGFAAETRAGQNWSHRISAPMPGRWRPASTRLSRRAPGITTSPASVRAARWRSKTARAKPGNSVKSSQSG